MPTVRLPTYVLTTSCTSLNMSGGGGSLYGEVPMWVWGPKLGDGFHVTRDCGHMGLYQEINLSS